MTPVTDIRDTRVLIPRVRRALLGPHASGSAVAANEYSDEEVNAMIADAIADIILYSYGLFGHQLQVAARDDQYMSPIAWITDTEMDQEEGSVIVSQAALSHFANIVRGIKTAETIQDEAQTWTYEIAASVLTEQIKGLRTDRDAALEVLFSKNRVTEDYINFLHVRDKYTDVLVEPFTWSEDWRFLPQPWFPVV